MVSLASPITTLTKASSPLGATYAAAVWNGKLYVGSNSGLYVKSWSSDAASDDQDFRLVPGLQGQVWDLKVIDGQLLCGHTDGTFRINDPGIERISAIPGGWKILPLTRQGEKILLQGTYNGLHVYRKNSRGLWTYSHKVKGVPPIPVKGLVSDKKGVFWVAHAYKGLFRMELNDDCTEATRWQEYEAPRDLPSEYTVEIIPWKNRLLIRSGNRFFTPNEEDKLIPDREFVTNDQEPFKIRSGLNDEWFKIYRDRIILEKTDGRSRNFDLALVRNSETVVPITPTHYLFCLGNGYALFDRRKEELPAQVSVAPIIRKVTSLINPAVAFATDSRQKITSDTRSIRINYSLPVYGLDVRYQYRLLGLSNRWSDWTMQSYTDFTNLASGNYEFQLRGSSNQLLTKYSFEVLPLWYETIWAKIFFSTLILLALLGVVFFQEKQFNKRRKRIVAEQDEKLRQQELAAEKQIMAIRNESLQKEITNKSQQLSNIAINVVRKNEILEEIREELQQVKEEMGQQLPNIHYAKLLNSIERNVSGKEDWQLFEDNFHEVHEEFFKRLKEISPEVSPSELRLAACLRMNLSTKEMAPALGISVRGVEIKRYRLRKKLDLDNDINLTEFMMEV